MRGKCVGRAGEELMPYFLPHKACPKCHHVVSCHSLPTVTRLSRSRESYSGVGGVVHASERVDGRAAADITVENIRIE